MTTPEELDELQEARRLLAEAEMAKATLHPGSVADRLADTTIFFANEVIRLRARVAELEGEVHALQEAVNAEEERANDANTRATRAEAELARRGQGVQVDDPTWLMDADPSSVLLYTLKEVPGRRGKTDMTNDLMIRIQNGTGSNHDLRALAARIRAALVSPGDGWRGTSVEAIANIIRENLSGPMFDEPHIQADHLNDITETARKIAALFPPASEGADHEE